MNPAVMKESTDRRNGPSPRQRPPGVVPNRVHQPWCAWNPSNGEESNCTRAACVTGFMERETVRSCTKVLYSSTVHQVHMACTSNYQTAHTEYIVPWTRRPVRFVQGHGQVLNLDSRESVLAVDHSAGAFIRTFKIDPLRRQQVPSLPPQYVSYCCFDLCGLVLSIR